MPPQSGAVVSRILFVGCSATRVDGLRDALPNDSAASLSTTAAQAPDAVLGEVRAQEADLVVLGPDLSLADRAAVLAGLRADDAVFTITLGERAPAAVQALADEHLDLADDPGARLLRCLREARLRRVALEAARRAERMAAVAQVAGGAAHDFANLLQVIRGQAEVLRADLADTAAAREPLAAIEEATEQAVTVVRRLLALGVEPVARSRRVAVDGLLAGLEAVFASLLGSRKRLELDLGCTGAELLIDPEALERALLNLVINAAHAMDPGGRLRVRTRRIDLARPSGQGSIPAVVVQVEDDGCGMPREVAERAFEPFFSTRAGAEASGLGLSSVMDVVRRAGGTASIESEPERGTTVRLVLPEFREVPATEHRARGAKEGVRGSILFVDDEPLVVNVVRNILERAGYEYLTAASAEEAEVLFDAHGQQVDLLVTDLKMPHPQRTRTP